MVMMKVLTYWAAASDLHPTATTTAIPPPRKRSSIHRARHRDIRPDHCNSPSLHPWRHKRRCSASMNPPCPPPLKPPLHPLKYLTSPTLTLLHTLGSKVVSMNPGSELALTLSERYHLTSAPRLRAQPGCRLSAPPLCRRLHPSSQLVPFTRTPSHPTMTYQSVGVFAACNSSASINPTTAAMGLIVRNPFSLEPSRGTAPTAMSTCVSTVSQSTSPRRTALLIPRALHSLSKPRHPMTTALHSASKRVSTPRPLGRGHNEQLALRDGA